MFSLIKTVHPESVPVCSQKLPALSSLRRHALLVRAALGGGDKKQQNHENKTK
jgi:hypothetical protein